MDLRLPTLPRIDGGDAEGLEAPLQIFDEGAFRGYRQLPGTRYDPPPPRRAPRKRIIPEATPFTAKNRSTELIRSSPSSSLMTKTLPRLPCEYSMTVAMG